MCESRKEKTRGGRARAGGDREGSQCVGIQTCMKLYILGMGADEFTFPWSGSIWVSVTVSEGILILWLAYV